MLADGQAKTGTAVLAGGTAVGLGEGIEQRHLLLGADTDAGVLDLEAQPPCVAGARTGTHAQPHLALVGELDGIAEQIGEDLLEAQWVTAITLRQVGIKFHGEGESLLARAELKQMDHVVDRLAQREGLAVDGQLAGLDLGEVEDVVEDAEQGLCRALDLLHVAAELAVERAA